jgi:ABC-type enterobactin transport system permease subunit
MSEPEGSPRYRFARILTLIGVVTTGFLLVGAVRLPSDLFRIAAVAIGSVAMVTAITGFLISAAQYQESEAG